jgi:mRNA-degrading endonuclease RelE of RelBE toxin-antitoxin system
MIYKIRYSPQFEKTVSKLRKKDPPLHLRLRKKIGEIIENPEHYKPLRGSEFGKRRAHVGSFVVKFVVRGNVIKILEFAHHD